MSEARKHHIEVQVSSAYVAEQSQPAADRYVFAYTVTITNRGRVAAQLLTRHWIITDANGRVEEVRGAGVVGEQPRLAPGESFRYTSGTVLATAAGTMEGSYQLRAEDGSRFDALIAPFTLAAPGAMH